MTSFSVYPELIDAYGTLPLVRDGIDEIRARDHNSLRDAIIKIEQELGIQPSGTFATVRARLDEIGDANAQIEAHLVDPEGAHTASAISIVDAGNSYVSTDVEGALGEIATVLPVPLDVIGEDNTEVPNSGTPSFVNQEGTLFVFNTSVGTDVTKTQPINITGVHIIEVGESNGFGTGTLELVNISPATLRWTAPGDSAGASVDISGLSAGEIATLSSSTASKKIRIARTSDALPVVPISDTFDVYKLNASTGAYSIPSVGIQDSNFITRTAVSDTDTSLLQFAIGGAFFPADKGTLVLQRKKRGAPEFIPIAVLDIGSIFDESKRETGQLVYTPSLANFDTITLFDRQPARRDYETLDADANGKQIYENFDLSVNFPTFQLAKYLIPVSNTPLVGGELEPITDVTDAEVDDKVSTYRLVHYTDGVTDFNGEPDPLKIFSISDTFGDADDGDNTVRMSNVFVDDDESRPNVDALVLRPVSTVENVEKIISGIHYYSGTGDVFDIEVRSDDNLFRKAYLSDDILRFTTDVFSFPTDDGYGTEVDVTELFDDGYALYSDANLPDFTDAAKDHAFYIVNSNFNDSRRVFPAPNSFSVRSRVSATFHDPFGSGDINDAYGLDTGPLRIVTNSYSLTRSTETKEWFTDEFFRVGTSESFDFNLDFGQFTGAGSGGTLSAWDNEAVLSPGELQCGGRFSEAAVPGLIFPQDNYDDSSIRPLQQAGTDYSNISFEVNSLYQRLFNLDVTSSAVRLRVQSSGNSLVSFEDINANNSSRPIVIYLKIPGPQGTGFLDIGKLAETGRIADEDGALIDFSGSAGDFTVECSFGSASNANTSNFVAMRIVYLASELASAQSKVISFVELLEAE